MTKKQVITFLTLRLTLRPDVADRIPVKDKLDVEEAKSVNNKKEKKENG